MKRGQAVPMQMLFVVEIVLSLLVLYLSYTYLADQDRAVAYTEFDTALNAFAKEHVFPEGVVVRVNDAPQQNAGDFQDVRN